MIDLGTTIEIREKKFAVKLPQEIEVICPLCSKKFRLKIEK